MLHSISDHSVTYVKSIWRTFQILIQPTQEIGASPAQSPFNGNIDSRQATSICSRSVRHKLAIIAFCISRHPL